jgi:hypothetical protein
MVIIGWELGGKLDKKEQGLGKSRLIRFMPNQR